MPALEIGLRADASIDIGTGHVMRCLTLADEFRRRGAVCRFICREHTGNLIDQILERGFEVLVLRGVSPSGALRVRSGTAYVDWLGTDQVTDAAQTREVLMGRHLDCLVVDHYALDERWERLMRPATRKVLVIDDLANRRHDCELLLDQNLGRASSDYAHLLPPTGTVLAGPRYALLRPEFAALRAQSLMRRSTERVQQLLVTLGGVDKDNLTLSVLKVLADSVLPADCQIVVVMGGGAPGLNAVREFAASTPGRIELRVNEKNMAALMVASDVAIGAAGATAWERCCLGLPTLLVLMAENQLAGGLALQARGAALVASAGLPLEAGLRAQLPHLLDPRRLSQMQAACIAMVDGDGVRRVVEELLRVDL
jgi:UDP-2,4-diacetamido-2,4,6-trideoxy-beta-L-altropyranose hydrolase